MPMYRWHDAETKGEVEVIRSFDEYTREPDESELPPTFPAPTSAGRKWMRVIAPPLVVKGAGWGGSKGNW